MKVTEQQFNEVKKIQLSSNYKELDFLLTQNPDDETRGKIEKTMKEIVDELEKMEIPKTKTKKITIEVEFETDEFTTEKEIDSAIIKGIYYGLDIRRIAAPEKVKSISFL